MTNSPINQQLIQSMAQSIEQSLKNRDIDPDPTQETYMDFIDFNPSAEIGPDSNSPENHGLYLAISPDTSHNIDEQLDEFLTYCHLLIPHLINLISFIFTENTNSDPCSFNIQINTNHMDTSDQATWEIVITITDYLS